MQGDDLWMLPGCHRSSLGTEALKLVWPREFRRPEQLERDDSIYSALARAPNHGHPAATNFLEQLVITETVERGSHSAWIGAGGGLSQTLGCGPV